MSFIKSDIGAQAAWKGYSSQTLYIASRIISATPNEEYYPEHLEDLLIKRDGQVIEAIQVKNLSTPLTISDLASTKESKVGEGFFKRTCSLRNSEHMLQKVRIVYFGELGQELQELSTGNVSAKNKIIYKLVNDHGLSNDDALWILSKIHFEKVDAQLLEEKILKILQSYIPTMAAPDLARTLLIQYISDLSKTKGYTSLPLWQEKNYKIGVDIASIDGYYKEYQKSLVRLCDIISNKPFEILKREFSQGVSTHPVHIRSNLDFTRSKWIEKIGFSLSSHKAVIIKGVSGQGKSALCYRFLLNNYPEQLVFCIRHIQSSRQAENLVSTLQGIVKHARNIIIYIDVNPGETNWVILLQELQARGVSVPVLVSIRDEDFKLSKVDGSVISIDIIDLHFSKIEAEDIYISITSDNPHPIFRSFDEAWKRFGEGGPFLEFIYLLNNNQTLRQRLIGQIEKLISEKNPDSWLILLNLVCYAGKIGCPVIFEDAKRECYCDTAIAALDRMSKEYLLKSSDDGRYIETLHPLRASIIYDILLAKMAYGPSQLLLAVLKCIEGRYAQLILMDYFTQNPYDPSLISEITAVSCRDWTMSACMLNTMLWLDVKLYVERNQKVFDELITNKGKGWLVFAPFDISGELRPNEFISESLISIFPEVAEKITPDIERMKKSLTSAIITYDNTGLWVKNSTFPLNIPKSDSEWSDFGYSLFWLAKRKQKIQLPFSVEILREVINKADLQAMADVALGLFSQESFNYYTVCESLLRERIIRNFSVMKFAVSETEVSCKFIPPYFDDEENNSENLNHFWTMNMMGILSKIYPDKEYIGVKLIGVDLFGDLGIQALDYEKRIHRSNLPYKWITEINSWLISRINYAYRPEDWQAYVQRVDAIRREALSLVNIIIGVIDYLYKNRFHSNERIGKLKAAIDLFKNLIRNDLLLPKDSVDPYCLYREDMILEDNGPNNLINKLSLHTISALSFDLYKDFRKSLNDICQRFDSFLDRFPNVLVSRIKGEEIDESKNPKLTLINLFNAAKALFNMQQEYDRLFLPYASKEYTSFACYEQERMLTLLNIWHYVLSNPPGGNPIAYNAKQYYRKTSKFVLDCFEKCISSIGMSIYTYKSTTEDTKTLYLLQNYDPLQQIPFEKLFEDVCLELRKQWKEAIGFQSMRWYLETHWPKMVFVPLYKGLPVFNGFQIPLYNIFNVDEEQLITSLFPAEIPIEVYSDLGINYLKVSQWLKAVSYVGKLRMMIIQYNDVINEICDKVDICEQGVKTFQQTLLNHIGDTITNIENCMETSIHILLNIENDEVAELLSITLTVFNDIPDVIEVIESLQRFDDLPEQLNNAVLSMALLSPYLIDNN